MKQKVLFVTLSSILSLSLYASEPSAFGAGDLDSPQPYGLSSSEKIVLKNKNELKDIILKTKTYSYKIDSMQERLDGLQSIVENLTRNSHQNKIDLHHLEDKHNHDLNSSNEYEKRLSEITQKNLQHIDELNTTLQTLNELVSTIKLSYVSKDEFNNLINDFNSFKKILKEELKPEKVKKVSKKKRKTNWEISKEAESNFEKKYYTKAIESYEYLIKQNFKPAYAHYMIGEMKYRRKNYSEAIAYFKKSAELYSKADYMPKLMLHTAIAMEATGDIQNAKAFYNAIASSYPNTKEANLALENLETIK